MKESIKYLLTGVMFCCSCNYLDIVPDKLETLEKAFAEMRMAERYLATCYHYLPTFESPNNNPGVEYAGEMWTLTEEGVTVATTLTRIGNNISSPQFNYWDGLNGGTAMWQAIRHCNNFLDNIQSVPDMSEELKERWAAEVTFLKAFYHWWLVQLYGPVPLMRSNLPVSASPEEVQVFRDPVDDCIDYIVELLDDAIEKLPDFLDSEMAELGRITRPIAMAFKAKVLIHAASPFFNGNTGYAEFKDKRGVQMFSQTVDPKKWEKARVACREAIELCEQVGHALYRYQGEMGVAMHDSTRLALTPSQIFNSTGVDNTNVEAIWKLNRGYASTLQSWLMPLVSGRGALTRRLKTGPTMEMAELFYSSHGVPIDEDKDWSNNGWYQDRYQITVAPDDHRLFIEPGFRTANLQLRREYRFYGNIASDGSRWYGGKYGTTNESTMTTLRVKMAETSGRSGTNQYTPTGMFCRKLVSWECNDGANINTPQWTFKNSQYAVIRLADLYLLYAEALNETAGPQGDPNGLTDLDSPYTWLNRIRERAGIGPVGASWENWAKSDKRLKYVTKEGLRDIIHQERLIELAFEGNYWFDIRRWSGGAMARYDVMDIMNRPIRGWNTLGSGDDFYNVATIHVPTYAFRDYLLPIREINITERNPNLVQNPGW